jgi:tetratricopeptide (TPR) repeat protein
MCSITITRRDIPYLLCLSPSILQLLANATSALERGDFAAALHMFLQTQMQSVHEAEAVASSPATAATKSVQFAGINPPGIDLKSSQVGQGLALHGAASCHRALSNLSKAQECYTESLRHLTKGLGGHHPELASVWNNLGSLQSQLNRMTAALECYEHAMDILKALNSRSSCQHLSKVGDCLSCCVTL